MPRVAGRIATVVVVAWLLIVGVPVVAPIESPVPTRIALSPTVEDEVVPRDPIREWSEATLATMSVEDKARSLFIHHVAGQDPEGMRVTVAARSAGGAGAGGVILMRDNVPASAEGLVTQMTLAIADPELPPIVAIDEEGGEVQRLAFDPFAGADYLRTAPVDETAVAFAGRGALLASVGINLNLGIVADVTSDRYSFIYDRTLGDDAPNAAERVTAAVRAESESVASTLKHFPGHGRTPADSHTGVPTTDIAYAEWVATDAVPFQAGIDAGARAVMFGHLVYSSVDALPASLSPTWHRILHENLGFKGIAITDDLRMLQDSGDPTLSDPYANVIVALNAGNDALLYVLPADPRTVGIDREQLVQALVAAVGDGRVSAARLDEAALTLLEFRRSLAPGAMEWIPPCDPGCLLGGWLGESPSSYIAD